MHYYQFNIGDYSSHTSRLSMFEDLAYRRLLDLYYLNERPFNGCSTTVARDIGMSEKQGEVDYVLSKFFPKCDDEWVNARAQKEIEAYKGKKKTASKAGKASAKARQAKASERMSNDRSTTVQQDSNDSATKHKPLTINQEPLNNIKDLSPSAQPIAADKIPYLKIKDLWNEHCPNLKGVRDLTQKRKTAIKKLWNQKNDAGDYPYRDSAFYIRWFTFCNDDPWYNGTDPNSGSWVADFIFCMKVDNILGKQE